MHPVQAAPRQRAGQSWLRAAWQDAPRAGSAEAKFKVYEKKNEETEMHPVQAAPRQSLPWRRWRLPWALMHPVQAAPRQRFNPPPPQQARQDAPRAGSAEAKRNTFTGRDGYGRMHPVQAAPRQRPRTARRPGCGRDAPRAGSAEAKRSLPLSPCSWGCTPCRQRRGKGEHYLHQSGAA